MDDIARQSADRIIQLGDAFNGPIDAKGVASILRSCEMIHVRGNGERMVLSEDPGERSRSAQLVRELLDAATLDWARSWPSVASGPEYFAFHATPSSDVDYLVEDWFPAERLCATGGRSRRSSRTRSRLSFCAATPMCRSM